MASEPTHRFEPTAEDVAWAADLAQTPGGRRLLGASSPSFVGSTYLRRRSVPHQQRWLGLFQRYQRLLLLSPRDHGKTETAARLYPVWQIVRNRDIRILIISAKADAAAKRVDQIARDLQNPLLVGDYGPFRPTSGVGRGGPDGKRWRSSQFYVSGRRINSRDATVEGVGTNGSITGGHFDLIILDDPIELRKAKSATERRSALDWFYGTVMELCEPHTQVIIIGTRKHAADLYNTIIEDDPTFRVHTDVAIQRWPSQYEFVTREVGGRDEIERVDVSDDGKVLWADRWPIEKLLLKYRANPASFLRENQNQLVDDESAVFKRVFFTGGALKSDPNLRFPGCRDRGRRLLRPGEPFVNTEGLHILQAWDLSLVDDKVKAEEADSDYTLGVTFGYDPRTERRYLLGLWRDRGLLPTQVRAALRTEAARFRAGDPDGVRFVAIERNNFGNLHHWELQRATDLPLVPHTTTGPKKADPYEGVTALVGLFSNGKWVLPYGDEPSKAAARLIEDEFVGLGVEAHDDSLMAIWIGECLLRRYKALLAKQQQIQERKGRAGVVRRSVSR